MQSHEDQKISRGRLAGFFLGLLGYRHRGARLEDAGLALSTRTTRNVRFSEMVSPALVSKAAGFSAVKLSLRDGSVIQVAGVRLANAIRFVILVNDRIDFEDMIVRVTDHVKSGRYESPYRHLLVDEFQDISDGRARLLMALTAQHDDARIFAVGDDWQSIYRFERCRSTDRRCAQSSWDPTRHEC